MKPRHFQLRQRGVFVICFLFAALFLGPSVQMHGRPNTFQLAVQTAGSGSVSKNPNLDHYPDGSVVTLTATPAEGWNFSQWSGDATGTGNPVNVEINGNKSVTAHFVAIPTYTLTVAKQGSGNVELSPSGGTYLSNSIVTVTAQPAEGWAFAGWSGDLSGSDNPTSIRMDAAKSVVALFGQKPVIQSAPSDRLANLGDDITFSVTAMGAEPLTYEWKFGTSPVAGGNSSTLAINNVKSTDEGLYTVTVSNSYGSAAASARLILNNGCSGPNVVTEPNEAELRAAIALGGTVRLCFNGTVVLSSPIQISTDVTLDAANRAVVISGNNATRLFEVTSGTTFSATNVTFAHGVHAGVSGMAPTQGEGGAILNNGGVVKLTSCLLHGNKAAGGWSTVLEPKPGARGMGGAIANFNGNLIFVSSTFSNNISAGGNASVPMVDAEQSGESIGGAVGSVGGTVHIVQSTFVRNSADGGNGVVPDSAAKGGALYLEGTVATIHRSVFSENRANGTPGGFGQTGGDAFGGGIFATGRIDLVECIFDSNRVTGGASSRNALPGVGEGGALYLAGTFNCESSILKGNLAHSGDGGRFGTAGRGGAIYNSGDGAIFRSVLHDNTAEGGYRTDGFGVGGIGSDAEGGAIYNRSILRLTNNTIALNTARSGGGFLGAPNGYAHGGGLFNETNGVMQGMNLTIASNIVVFGEGVAGFFPTSVALAAVPSSDRKEGANVFNKGTGEMRLKNSILAYPGENSNASGLIQDQGHNISSDGSANFNSGTSFNFTNPRLLPLADYGGPTWTMALAPNSPAIDFGGPLEAPAIDQRGLPRPAGVGYDIGSFEFQLGEEPQGTLMRIARQSDSSIRVEFSAKANSTYVLQSAGADFQWSIVETIPASPSSSEVSRVFNTSEPVRYFRVIKQP